MMERAKRQLLYHQGLCACVFACVRVHAYCLMQANLFKFKFNVNFANPNV